MKMRGMMIAALAMLFSTHPLWVAADQNAEIQSDTAGQNKNKSVLTFDTLSRYALLRWRSSKGSSRHCVNSED